MGNRPTVTSLALLAVLLLGTSALSISNAIAQNAIPFTHVVIDPNPPLQSHCKAVGDIDGDGFPDVLVGSAQDGYGFFWYRYPQWTKYTIVPPGVTGFTTDMQVGDVDGDGDLDAIIPKGWSKGQSVFWYENPRPLGDPAIDAWIEHSIGVAPAHDVEVGDINNDGKLDVVVRDGKTTVFVQNTPTSWTKNEINTRAIEGTALGDIDKDGDLDIAINGYWLENPLPSGNPATSAWPEYVITTNWPTYAGALIADLNEDGRPDVALSPSETTGRFSWFEAPVSPKSGGWVEHTIDASAEYLHTFKAFDMDLDGDLDLITAEMLQSQNPDEVCVYINEGGAASWFKQVIATTGSHNIRVADIGNDGDMDIVGINWQGTTPLEMWQNDLDPQYSLADWDRHVIDANKPWRAVFIDAGDLNGDALPDIVTGGWWYRNPGDPAGSWARNVLGAPLNNMAAVHDFDGDGLLDVLGTEGTGSTSNDQFLWAHNEGQGAFTILQNVPNGDGDFLQGVAVDHFQSQNGLEVILSWHAGKGGLQRLTLPADPVSQTWTWDEISPTTENEQVSGGDIDRDGDKDLLLGSLWMRNDGTSWSSQTLTNTNSLPDRNRLADINGDGRLDAVIGYEAESKLAWYEQGASATAIWTEHSIATNFFAPMSLDVADLDRDGDIDIVAGEHNLASPSSSRLYVFENNGGGTSWTTHEVYTGDEHHDGAQLVDMDGDGDLDIISIGWTHGRVLLYENKSSGGGGPPDNRAPVANFTADPTSGEAPLNVNFNASGSTDPDGDPLTYAWDFGDGGTGSGSTITHLFSQTGSFLVRLTVSDGELTGNASRTIFATGPPDTTETLQSHWPLDESGGNIARDVAGSNDGTLVNGPVWQPGSGKVSGALHFDGVDDLVDLGAVDVTGGSGLTIALWVWVDAFPIPDSRFISKASGTADADHYWMLGLINNSGLRFRLKVDGVTRVLMTGAGEVALGQWYHMAASYDGTAMRIYKNGVEVGSTPVSGQLTANPAVLAALANQPVGAGQRGLNGRLDDVRIYNYALSESEIVKLADITVNQQPVASFTASPTSGQAPLDVSFDASNASDPDGDALTYAWNFGDGSAGTGMTVSHTFTAGGSFDVTLTVSDGELTANASQAITVTTPVNQPPVASFTASPIAGVVPLDVNFNASASTDPDGDALTYSWDFGDGSTGSGVTTAHTFTATGTFQVSLAVSDGTDSANTSRTILVSAEPGPTDSLQAFWPLDETAGTIAADIAGVNDGTLQGGPVWQPNGGKVAGALRFDGVDDLVDLGSVDVAGGSGLTLALWVQVSGLPIPDSRFISKATGTADNDHYWMLGLINDSALRFRLKLDATTHVLLTGSGEVVQGQWIHVAASYDGIAMRIFKNGAQVASMPASGQVAVNPGVSAALGNQPVGVDPRALDGMLDDVRIYNYALSEGEIMALADMGENGSPVATFSADVTSGNLPLEVSFDASSSWDPDGDLLSYVWDFGDGSSGIGITTTHTFTQMGTFQVTLTVNDGELWDIETKSITVLGAPGVFSMIVGILQNPYVSEFLDIYVAGSEPLDPSSLVVTARSVGVQMTLLDAEHNIWQGQHQLTSGGIVDIKACAETLDSRSGCASTIFSAGFVIAGGGAQVSSADNTFSIRIPDGGVRQGGYLLVVPSTGILSDTPLAGLVPEGTESADEADLPAYTVSPPDLIGGTTVTVEFRYTDLVLPEGVELSQIYVAQAGVGALKSHVDTRAGVIRATAGTIGEFSLEIGAPGVSPLADGGFAKLHQNFPNPFNPSTTIEFELQARQSVEIAIYDVAGRFVARLLDEEVAAGIGRVRWDGKSDRGEEVRSGVYFVRLVTSDATAIRKLLLVR